MDSDLVQKFLNFSEYGIPGILLAAILISDLPKSFFGELIKKLFAREPKRYWPAKPYHSILPISGIIGFKQSRKFRKLFVEELIKKRKSKISQLLQTIADAQVLSYPFPSRKDIDLSNAISLVNGLPGAGKSSFIINYLEEISLSGHVDFIFYFDAYLAITKYPKLKENNSDIPSFFVWEILGEYLLDNTKRGQTLSAGMLSYLLSRKKVYFIVDGIDKEQECANILTNIKRYVDANHPKNKELKIIVSSRTALFKDDMLWVNSIKLQPLGENEIKNFFFIRSGKVGLDLLNNPHFGELVDPVNSIVRFEKELTQTPLFVEIVIIILKEKGIENVIADFHKSIASIYKLFVKTLFERSPQENREYTSFYSLYRKLARRIWDTGNSFDSEIVNDIFSGTPFTLSFMEESGLLVRNDFNAQRYSFIHQTLPDILAIETMVLNKDFSAFRNVETVGDDIVIYLREEIDSIPVFSKLLEENLAVSARILDLPFMRKIALNDIRTGARMIIKVVVASILNQPEVRGGTFSEHFLLIIKKLSEWQTGVYDLLLEEVSAVNKTYEVLSLLLLIRSEVINTFIVGLVSAGESRNVLKRVLADNSLLIQMVDKNFNTREVILLALESDIEFKKRAYKKKFVEKLDSMKEDELSFYLRIEKIRKEVVFKEYEHKDSASTKKLNDCLAQFEPDHFFIPKGSYDFGKERLTNSASIVIVKAPAKVLIDEDSLDKALKRLEANAPYEMWTFDQFRIGYRFFEGKLENSYKGFLGLNSFEDIQYEAVKKDNNGRVSFGYFVKGQGNSNIVLADGSKRQFLKQTVLWRLVTVYS